MVTLWVFAYLFAGVVSFLVIEVLDDRSMDYRKFSNHFLMNLVMWPVVVIITAINGMSFSLERTLKMMVTSLRKRYRE